MNKITVNIDNNKNIVVASGTKYIDISKNSFYKDTVLGVKKNNQILSLNDVALNDEAIEFFDINSIEGSKIYKAALKFILEVAIKTLYNEADIEFLHSVPGGMLGEIKSNIKLTETDIAKIKAEMENIVKNDYPILKYNILKKEAIHFYEENNLLEKAKNVQVHDNIVTIYKLKNYLNYFYVNMPYSTGYIKSFDLKYLHDNRLIILYPSNLTGGILPTYTPHDNIVNAFYKGKSWLKMLKAPFVSDLNNLVSNSSISGFIESCELYFNDQIKKVSEEIQKRENCRFIMLAGPSSSGKTTTSRVLGAYLRSKGYNPLCISIDDYFKERKDTPKDEFGNYDFESLAAIDIDLLNKDLVALLKGEKINVPVFNFKTGEKEYHNNYLEMTDNSIVLIEGLHSLNEELTSYIPKVYKYKVYLSPFIPLNIDRHNYISTLDLRLLRRIIRDNRTRGHSVKDTLHNWQNVRRGEEKYIFPFTNEADIIINTALPYELGVLKVYAEPLLLSVDTDSSYYEEARRLLKFLHIFYSIPSEYVSKSSILREFIGGNNND